MRNFILAAAALLGLLLNTAWAQTELIVNGGFESSAASIAPWQIIASPSPANNVLSAAGAYGGSSECLLLGVGNSYSQDVYQTIVFPSNLISATLSFYYNIVTTDLNGSEDATLYIELKDSNGIDIVPRGGPVSNLTPTGGYTPFSTKFVTAAGSAFAGKTVKFHFVANTLNVFAGYTQFFIDNVSIQIATTADIPANDNFTNATIISGAAASLSANNNYTTKETGEPSHAGNVGGHSVWWRWVAPSNGIVALKATGTTFQPLLAAYTGNAINQLTPVAANNGNPAQISFKAVAGTTYLVAVDGYAGGTGGFLLSLGFASDVTPPVVTITSPGAGSNVTNSTIQVKGTASDNIAVTQVQYRLENRAGTNDYEVATGTNSWMATVADMYPGYNLVRVRAFDTSSNFSTAVTRTFDYLVGSPITLIINGRGSITGATNGQLLNLGNLYNLTAVPASGFGFAYWNGDLFSVNPTLGFYMQSNLTLRVNFVDIAKPTLGITNLAVGGSVSNQLFILKGKAGDNLGVTNVFYKLNNSVWNTASSTNSWTNWFANLELTPGTNIISAYAQDPTGNRSLTNTVKFTYVLSAQLSVSTNGKGSISPNLNGVSLQIGRNYVLTATPAAGFAFTNWTDGGSTVFTNKPALTFLMASNLSFTANFKDIAKPTVSVTNIPVSGNVSNNLFTVKGKAADNLGLANVLYNLNHTSWDGVATENVFTNWSKDLTLTPGTNLLSTYAVDTTGNYSTTNTVKIVYILSAPLTVNTNGKGSISPALNNALLQIGKNFTLSATPAAGFAFTNWTDGSSAIVTNKPTLRFLMASNLAFTANFVDITKPTVSVTNIPVSGNVSNAGFTIKGKAGDNVDVANVVYNLNHGGWNDVNSGNGWTNWFAELDLTPGTNLISTYAVDTTGNLSLTNTVKLVYILSAPLLVSTNGKGSISPSLNGAVLQIGRNYTLTATPAAGFAFTNWTDGSAALITNKPVLTFLMASNLSFTANFVDVQKPTLSITNVAIGQRWSNNLFTVKGIAADNFAVSNVFYNLNNNGWSFATTSNQWANWSRTLDLTPGTNTISAYAIDIAGNVSPTNTVKITYVVSALVSVQILGGGAITPNYDGQSLALGGNYSMRALATNGFVFSYWSGDVEMTTNKSVNFNLASNMTILANFVDVVRPTNTITLPTASQTWSSSFINVAGNARDNGGVSNVRVQVNHEGWTEALTGDGFTNWISTNLMVTLETNLVESYAVDFDGNISSTNRVSFVGFFPNAGMVAIPAGTFTVGDLLDDYASYNLTGNSPTNVTLSAFNMDTNLVSYSQWQSVYNWATNHGYRFDSAGAGKDLDHPVQTVSWYDSIKWCNARSLKSRVTPMYYTDTNFSKIFTNGHNSPIYVNWAANGYRLPTEAEWETAARGGWPGPGQQRFPWSDHVDWTLANYKGDPLNIDPNGFYYDLATAVDYDPDFKDGPLPYTNPVGVTPNGYGLNDMAGNVNQWCWDWYGTPYGQPTTVNPTGANNGTYRVVRGGSWNNTANHLRCAYREKQSPTTQTNDIGFRCVRRD